MSRFTVIVVGDNAEELLDPFDENLELDEPLTEVVHQDLLDAFMNDYPDETGTIDEVYLKYGKEWNDNCWKKENGEWIEFYTYNPNSKWDWYSLGGRWSGFFKTKKGSGAHEEFSDSCRIDQIDFEGMRESERERASKVFDLASEIIGDLKLEHSLSSLDSVKKFKSVAELDELRDTYNKQEIVKKFRQETREDPEHFGYFSEVEDFLVPKEEYVQKAVNSAVSPFAYLDENGWIESGEMGVFGMFKESIEPKSWAEIVNEKLESLPGDTLVSLYDLHV